MSCSRGLAAPTNHNGCRWLPIRRRRIKWIIRVLSRKSSFGSRELLTSPVRCWHCAALRHAADAPVLVQAFNNNLDGPRCSALFRFWNRLAAPIWILSERQRRRSRRVTGWKLGFFMCSLTTVHGIGSVEAQINLKFLQTLQEPCEKIAKSEPKKIPPELPNVLHLIRMIWTLCPYYHGAEVRTHLWPKVRSQACVVGFGTRARLATQS